MTINNILVFILTGNKWIGILNKINYMKQKI